MKELIITFEKGGSFAADLDEARAPNNVREVWDRLPIEGEVGHGMLSGDLLFSKVARLQVHQENPKVMGIPQGCVALEAIPPGVADFPPGILIAYGEKVRFATPFTPEGEPIWAVGQIRGDLRALFDVGWRIHTEGYEQIRFERRG